MKKSQKKLMSQKIYLVNKKVEDGRYIGLDLASKSGWSIVDVFKGSITLVDYGSISFPKGSDELLKLHYLDKFLSPVLDKYIIRKDVTVIIEDCFLGKWNPKVFKLLARLEGYMLYRIRHMYPQFKPAVLIYNASHARKKVGLKGTAKKEEIVNEVNKMVKQNLFSLTHNDITDSIILAISGGIAEEVE